MYSAQKVNKQGDNIPPYCIPFQNLNVSCSMSVLTVASSPTQVSQKTGKMVCYSHLSKNFLQSVVLHRVTSFSVNEAEVDFFFLEFPCFLHDPKNIGNLISGSSAFSKPSLYM